MKFNLVKLVASALALSSICTASAIAAVGETSGRHSTSVSKDVFNIGSTGGGALLIGGGSSYTNNLKPNFGTYGAQSNMRLITAMYGNQFVLLDMYNNINRYIFDPREDFFSDNGNTVLSYVKLAGLTVASINKKNVVDGTYTSSKVYIKRFGSEAKGTYYVGPIKLEVRGHIEGQLGFNNIANAEISSVSLGKTRPINAESTIDAGIYANASGHVILIDDHIFGISIHGRIKLIGGDISAKSTAGHQMYNASEDASIMSGSSKVITSHSIGAGSLWVRATCCFKGITKTKTIASWGNLYAKDRVIASDTFSEFLGESDSFLPPPPPTPPKPANACIWSYSWSGNRTGGGGLASHTVQGKSCKASNIGESFKSGNTTYRCTTVPTEVTNSGPC